MASTHDGHAAETAASTVDTNAEVIIIGAGPVGLTMANLLGFYGVHTLVIEERDTLIDYPRGVGLDDEALRTFQRTGLLEMILPHTSPNQIMRFVDAKRRVLAELAPNTESFGWPKRNGFVQPLVDAELRDGLDRFPHVAVTWGSRMESVEQGHAGVSVTLSRGGAHWLAQADYVVGCDGGSSTTRGLMGESFQGTTSATRWLVMDIATDPLGRPNVEVGADPQRPYVTLSVAHGIRRFEFMLHDDESDEQAVDPAFITGLLTRFLPSPDRVELIRRRVYTHHSRIASAFRRDRILIAGDAAHLMPVWQGQGYNSGIRDAANLAWKLAAVVTGLAKDSLLETYDLERRGHAKAMIDLSTTVGRVISPTNRRIASLRDFVARAASAVPALKQYIVQMRFKPMPRYESGAVVHEQPPQKHSPVGTMFIQPRVDTRESQNVLLDEVLGQWFAVLCWNNNPRAVLDSDTFARWKALGAQFVALRPLCQLYWSGQDDQDAVIVGDRTGDLKSWFDTHEESVLFLRPDRFVAGACVAQRASEVAELLLDACFLTPGGTDATRSLLCVPQPVASAPRTGGGSG